MLDQCFNRRKKSSEKTRMMSELNLKAVAVEIRALTEKNDGVIVINSHYGSFEELVLRMDRRVLMIKPELFCQYIDVETEKDSLTTILTSHKVKLLVLLKPAECTKWDWYEKVFAKAINQSKLNKIPFLSMKAFIYNFEEASWID